MSKTKEVVKNNTSKMSRNFVLLLYPENVEHVGALEYLKSQYQVAYIMHSKDKAYTKEEVDKLRSLTDEEIKQMLLLAPSSDEEIDVEDFDKTESIDNPARLKNFLRVIGNADLLRDIDGKLTICDTEVKFNETGDLLKKEHWHVVLTLGSKAGARSSSAIAKELGISKNFVQCCSNVNGALTYLIHYGDKSKYQYGISDVEGSKKLIEKLMQLLEEDDAPTETEVIKCVYDFIDSYESEIPIEEFQNFPLYHGSQFMKFYRKNYLLFKDRWYYHNQRVKAVRDEQNARELAALAKKP